MLRWRLLGAVAILVPLLALLYADYAIGPAGAWLLLPAIAIVLLATDEVLWLLASQNHRPVAWSVYAGVLLVTLSACSPLLLPLLTGKPASTSCPLFPAGLPLAALAASVALVFVGEMRRYREPGGVIVNVALGLFVIAYLGVSYAFLALLRFHESSSVGMAALISVMWIVKLSDVGAYFVGRTMGRTKMTPLLSPGKTVEGAIGGLITACAASWVYFQFLAPRIVGESEPRGEPWKWLLYGLLLAVAGMIGDLAESLLKRDMQQKDSSRWLRGLGGVMDIVDSVLLAAPVAYVCWVAGLLS